MAILSSGAGGVLQMVPTSSKSTDKTFGKPLIHDYYLTNFEKPEQSVLKNHISSLCG